MSLEKVSVLGAGAWGTALANHLARSGKKVDLWAYEPEVAAEVNADRRNSVFLPDIKLEEGILASNELEKALAGAKLVFVVIPSHVMETVLKQAVPFLDPEAVVVSCTKGIENEKLRLPSEIMQDNLPEGIAGRLVCLSGPSFAKEVAMGLPTAVTAASGDPNAARLVQQEAASGNLRIYTNDDVTGVELGGVVKNVIAIAAGISDGMEFGHNARAGLITRGLEETIRLGRAMGAREITFRGLSGIGDLVLTASGDLSRNRTVGKRLGKGEKLEQIVNSMRMVAEGVKTSRAVYHLSRRYNVDMPISTQVYKVCHEGMYPRHAVEELLARALRPEFG